MLNNRPDKDYSDGKTKQSFKESCDINNLLLRAQRAGGLNHLETFAGEYGDFSDFDFVDAHIKMARAKEIFDHLPINIKKEFNQDPGQFFAFANDPGNAERLGQLFSELAKPGYQLKDIDLLAPAPAEPQPAPDPGPVDPGPGPGPTE